MADVKFENFANLRETAYLYVFEAANYESEVKMMK